MLATELLNDLQCAGCGTPLMGRSSAFEPGQPYASIGRTVIPELVALEKRGAGKPVVVAHIKVYCLDCRKPSSDIRMASDSFRVGAPVSGVVARSPKKRKKRAVKS